MGWMVGDFSGGGAAFVRMGFLIMSPLSGGGRTEVFWMGFFLPPRKRHAR
jgi:hypothetical protein